MPSTVTWYPGFYFNWRPDRMPGWVRSLEPGVYWNQLHGASDNRFLGREVTLFPVFARLQDGSTGYVEIRPNRQILEEPFRPLGITILPGEYAFMRYKAALASDGSRLLSVTAVYEAGSYYDGSLIRRRLAANFAPSPHAQFSGAYEEFEFRSLGPQGKSGTFKLWEPEIRLALGPALHLSGIYQWNQAASLEAWDLRLAWEFMPLSKIHLIARSRNFYTTEGAENGMSLIAKFNWVIPL